MKLRPKQELKTKTNQPSDNGGGSLNLEVPPEATGLYFMEGFSEQFEDIFYNGVRVCSAHDLELILHHLLEMQMAVDIGFCIKR